MRRAVFPLVSMLLLSSCGTARSPVTEPPRAASSAPAVPSDEPPAPPSAPVKRAAPRALPKPGNPDGHATVPPAARAVDTSTPDRVVGSGTAASCTSDAVVDAVAAGGVIAFDCGATPVTIMMTSTATVRNDRARVVLDGGGRVTLSGGGKRRVLYQNTCERPATARCQDQDEPELTLQNLVLANGDSTGSPDGGGAVFVRGGRLRVIGSRFTGNRCDLTGPDLGGAALRVLSVTAPVYVVNSTFTGGRCSNGGALSSIGVSWTILNSVFRDNQAVGRGANPPRPGTRGGGSGGALYLDGNSFTATLSGSLIENNTANEGGGAVFFVSNDRTGTLTLAGSTLRTNPSAGFETPGYPGVFFLGKSIRK
ncbi:hypothetical protein [Actinoplanes sp. NPDC049265]|uniref:hypothetical protein n=1 Tax=Actinoplanes sp. NPDC049265 TaxID=3363902 RepID=UPI0037125E13